MKPNRTLAAPSSTFLGAGALIALIFIGCGRVDARADFFREAISRALSTL